MQERLVYLLGKQKTHDGEIVYRSVQSCYGKDDADYRNDDYGNQQFLMSSTTMSGTFKKEFVEKRDQRFDFGLVGGLGVEWRFKLLKKDWAWQIIEARIYYSTLSTQKDYMKIRDPRYNTTLALQSGLCYFL